MYGNFERFQRKKVLIPDPSAPIYPWVLKNAEK